MKLNTRTIVICACVGALYAALTMALSFISYGTVQFRISEVLCILPFFFPASAWGLFCGCLIANLLSPVGALDIIFGSLATLGAGVCTAALGKKYRESENRGWGRSVAACLMPVIYNGIVIGAVSSYVGFPAESFWTYFGIIGAEVAGGEAAVMLLLGLPLMRLIMNNSSLRRIITGEF